MGRWSWLARLGLYLVAVLVGLQFLTSLLDKVLSDGRAILAFVATSVVCHLIVRRDQDQRGHRGALERTPHNPSPRGHRFSSQDGS